jgi:CRISPR-associated protein Csa1
MYFLSSEEEQFVRRGLRAELRRQPVAEELRGWTWPDPPLKPVYDEVLCDADVRGSVCPTSRDTFLRRTGQVQSPDECYLAPEHVVYQSVAYLHTEAKRLIFQHGASCVPWLERLGDERTSNFHEARYGINDAGMPAELRSLQAYEAHRIAERAATVLSQFRCIGSDALATLVLPVSVNVPLEGRCLGLEHGLRVPAVSLPEMLVFQLRLGRPGPSDRLANVAPALALEGRFEAPCDLGCIVYLEFEAGRPIIQRDIYLIGDELRQTFIEQRDDRMRVLAMESDPGIPPICPPACGYLALCHPGDNVAQIGSQGSIVANRRGPRRPPADQTA